MPNLSPQEIWELNPTQLRTLLDSGQLKPKSGTIHFYTPSFTYYKIKQFCASANVFPTISVTGSSCALNCGHCGGVVLKTMHPAPTPKDLFELGVKLKQNGAEGVLVSGGCMPDGSVPLDNFVEVLSCLKHDLGLTVFVHTGIIGPETAFLLKKAGVDAALIDVIGSRETIQRTFNLKITPQSYVDSLKALDEAELNLVPHVVVGLDKGKLGGELNALKIIAENSNPKAIVIIAFMPIHGTEMEHSSPPKPIDIAKVAAAARQMFPNTPLALGCMRPKGKLRAETDGLAMKAGVDAVAFPSPETVEYVKAKGYPSKFSCFCCAQMYRDLSK